MSSMSDDQYFDAMSRTSSRIGEEGEEEEEEDGETLMQQHLNPSFASLSTGSLHNLDDESSDSEEDDLVTAAAEEGIIAVPGALRPTSATAASKPVNVSPSLPLPHIHWSELRL